MSFVVRRLAPEDRDLMRTLRLRSLRDAPGAFGSTYEREIAFPEDLWANRLRPDGNPHFVCTRDDGEAVGIVAAAFDESDPQVAWLVGMWVDASARGTGAADALVREALECAGAHDRPVVRLHVTDGNARAEGLYRRLGFVRTGSSFMRGRDNVAEIEMERQS
jgi:ribosomal protein S18 acetylase RimI-like enzyme